MLRAPCAVAAGSAAWRFAGHDGSSGRREGPPPAPAPLPDWSVRGPQVRALARRDGVPSPTRPGMVRCVVCGFDVRPDHWVRHTSGRKHHAALFLGRFGAVEAELRAAGIISDIPKDKQVYKDNFVWCCVCDVHVGTLGDAWFAHEAGDPHRRALMRRTLIASRRGTEGTPLSVAAPTNGTDRRVGKRPLSVSS